MLVMGRSIWLLAVDSEQLEEGNLLKWRCEEDIKGDKINCRRAGREKEMSGLDVFGM